MYSHLEYLEQWFCATSIDCVPKVHRIIDGFPSIHPSGGHGICAFGITPFGELQIITGLLMVFIQDC